MKRGCLIGCLVLIALVAGAAAIAFIVLDRLDVLHEAPAIPVEEYAEPAPALFVHVQLDRPEVTKLLTDALDQTPTWLIQKFTPHEVTFTVDPDAASASNNIVLALNLKRLTGFLDYAIRDIDEWRFWLNQEIVSAGQEGEGLYVIRSTIPFLQQLGAAPAEVWTALPHLSPAPAQDHLFHAHVDNRGGRGLWAIAPLLAQPPAEYDPARAPVADLAQVEGFLKRFDSAELTTDLLESGDLEVKVTVQAPTATAGESLLFFLMIVRDTAYKALLQERLVLEGHWQQDGTTLQGTFQVRGFRERAMEYIRARAN
ncbi:MAG: hypothetical protein IT368_05800 [Candidatus Hydrogenedentes bacterium]|nr:hypothetical protein [Candidatus Hydrogenedentota bacterium]